VWCTHLKTENIFLCENIENIGEVLSGNKNYFRAWKIIFSKKKHFRSNRTALRTRRRRARGGGAIKNYQIAL
jgi:hypothetical protein